jgi:hypothetical protein
MRSVRARIVVGVAAALLCLWSCRARPVPFVALEDSLEPLEAAFNAEAGRTRVLIIVAPT